MMYLHIEDFMIYHEADLFSEKLGDLLSEYARYRVWMMVVCKVGRLSL